MKTVEEYIQDIRDIAIKTDAKIETLETNRAQLLAALKEAVEDIENWGVYASGYFQKKYDLEGVIANHEKLIAEIEEAMK